MKSWNVNKQVRKKLLQGVHHTETWGIFLWGFEAFTTYWVASLTTLLLYVPAAVGGGEITWYRMVASWGQGFLLNRCQKNMAVGILHLSSLEVSKSILHNPECRFWMISIEALPHHGLNLGPKLLCKTSGLAYVLSLITSSVAMGNVYLLLCNGVCVLILAGDLRIGWLEYVGNIAKAAPQLL